MHTVCYGVRGIEGTVLEKDLPEDYQRMIIEGTVLKYPRTTYQCATLSLPCKISDGVL